MFYSVGIVFVLRNHINHFKGLIRVLLMHQNLLAKVKIVTFHMCQCYSSGV